MPQRSNFDMADHRGRFIVAAVENPEGFKPGRYYYVMHMETGRKVSRYVRRISKADRKAIKYSRLWDQGDRYWPGVDRCDELRDSKDVVPTIYERWFYHVFHMWPECAKG